MQDHTLRSSPQRHPHFPAVEVESLWETSPEPRIGVYASRISAARHRAFLFRGALAQMTDRTARHVLSTADERLDGAASWRPLAWDSKHIGLRAARLDLLLAVGDYKRSLRMKRTLIEGLIEDCRGQGIQHLTARVDCSDLSGIHALEASGFEFIDGIQTSARFLNQYSPADATSRFQTRGYEPRDLEDVISIARTSYVHDRFHADWAIAPEAADAVSAEWLRNSCKGMSDHVVVAADSSGVAAYVTCKVDRESKAELGTSFGTIGMVATAKRARGEGAATAATRAAIEWFAAQGVEIVEVGTQLSNIGAARLYQKCEFFPVSTTITFRILIDVDRSQRTPCRTCSVSAVLPSFHWAGGD